MNQTKLLENTDQFRFVIVTIDKPNRNNITEATRSFATLAIQNKNCPKRNRTGKEASRLKKLFESRKNYIFKKLILCLKYS